ncbi:hypothetical protein GWK47_010110 [Chionoecetes opilio]|uniref:Uncharacterized protein n=1 Tax=Chionoecetes opilio TaxID=41210 RepID=A0A8J4Y7F6_CHIOP|nr:hypothetical protein GWK47_010110 [Chionoecetes opilio]
MLERFTVRYYIQDQPSGVGDEARKELFCQKNGTMETFPNQQALLQHTKRAVYQAGIWTTCHMPTTDSQLAEGCGGHWIQKQSPGFLSGARSLRQQSCS